MMKCSVAPKLHLIKHEIYFRMHGHYRGRHEIKALSFVTYLELQLRVKKKKAVG